MPQFAPGLILDSHEGFLPNDKLSLIEAHYFRKKWYTVYPYWACPYLEWLKLTPSHGYLEYHPTDGERIVMHYPIYIPLISLLQVDYYND